MNREQALKQIFASRAYVLKTPDGYLSIRTDSDSSRLKAVLENEWKWATFFDSKKKAKNKYKRLLKKDRERYPAVVEPITYWNIGAMSAVGAY